MSASRINATNFLPLKSPFSDGESLKKSRYLPTRSHEDPLKLKLAPPVYGRRFYREEIEQRLDIEIIAINPKGTHAQPMLPELG